MFFCTFLPSGSILNPMNKIAELKRAKRLALSLLLIAAATFCDHAFPAAQFLGAGRKSYCRSGDGWRAGGLVCRGGAVSPHSHSVYFTTYGDYSP
ncbi:Uncharacterised protein [Salmonella enterica subsp. enterica]|uniref:Uncharacterized protein n=1 Tax=Salmonella enterica I TaxID=59201 RepID=A0A447TNP9_SALET|nr:Uncharacterised protein [Salmonella enterica subsp. enterica]